jgi:hypothetical protein
VPPKERALFALLDVVATETSRVTCDDVDVARAAGWTDEALFDAFTVVALFRFYNTWVDAAGVCAMAGEDFAASGRRIARLGYGSNEPGGS